MTEQEAIKVLTDKHTNITTDICDGEEWKKLKPARELAVSALEEIQQYREIGTVEECRIARKRWIKIKPKNMHRTQYMWNVGYCPNCNKRITSLLIFCPDCGQKLHWSDEGE